MTILVIFRCVHTFFFAPGGELADGMADEPLRGCLNSKP